jgi:hypothetical protein
MPPRSEAQRRAMRAAAAGDSTLGIPAKVGREYSKSDRGGKLPKRKKDYGDTPAGYDYDKLSNKAERKW